MTGYTIRNLSDVDDMAAKFGYGQDFEARFARRDLGCERIGISLQRLAPNTNGPFGHTHEHDEEIYVILSGSGRMKLDDDIVDIGPRDAIRVAPATLRGFAAGPDGLELLAFGTHSDTDASMRKIDW